ncbi:hypothetical protein CDAR_449871 [Caerostris darwini]|uniref:Uncharacterized protein n=1 Tax=Caerostris darwini TaxID=1538125 RepID=A0AAV4QQW0_9ARAC|nr:hypothetical protein CDAR_449871 [Caerostris darwini]
MQMRKDTPAQLGGRIRPERIEIPPKKRHLPWLREDSSAGRANGGCRSPPGKPTQGCTWVAFRGQSALVLARHDGSIHNGCLVGGIVKT